MAEITNQEGSLCAQHCLNALLQGQYFSPVDLADLAKQLDETEREQMAVAGLQTAEYQKFLQEPSNNLDDSGFFSIQVIDKALSVWGLGLIIFNSADPIAVGARRDPVQQRAYICNFRGHWLTIRKIGYQWFNLNSLLTGPELISDTYLSLFLKQLQEEGYSIFIVTGDLPECEADIVLRLAPAVQPVKPRLINENSAISSSSKQEDMEVEEDSQLQKALAESRRMEEKDDQVLQKALEMSMEGYIVMSNSCRKRIVGRRGERLVESMMRVFCGQENINPQGYVWEPESPLQENAPVPGPSNTSKSASSKIEEDESSVVNSEEVKSPDKEDLRQKRLAYLSKIEKKCDINETVKESSQSNSSETEGVSTTQCLANTNHKPDDDDSETACEDLNEDEMLKQAIELSMSSEDK